MHTASPPEILFHMPTGHGTLKPINMIRKCVSESKCVPCRGLSQRDTSTRRPPDLLVTRFIAGPGVDRRSNVSYQEMSDDCVETKISKPLCMQGQTDKRSTAPRSRDESGIGLRLFPNSRTHRHKDVTHNGRFQILPFSMIIGIHTLKHGAEAVPSLAQRQTTEQSMMRGEYHKYKQNKEKSEEMRIRDIVQCSRNTNRRVFLRSSEKGVVGVRCIDGKEKWWGCAHMQSVDDTV
jgi:hypothetical protein